MIVVVMGIILLTVIVGAFYLLYKMHDISVARMQDDHRTVINGLQELIKDLQTQNDNLVDHNEQLVGQRFDYHNKVYADTKEIYQQQNDPANFNLEDYDNRVRHLDDEYDREAMSEDILYDDEETIQLDLDYIRSSIGE